MLNLFRFTLTFVLLFAFKANARTCVENIIGVEPTKLILEKPELVEEILARRTFVKGLHFRIPEYAPLLVQMIQELDNVPARLSKVHGHPIRKTWLTMRARGFKAQLEQALPSLTYYQSIEFSFEFAWFFMKLLYLEEGDDLDDMHSVPDYILDLRQTLKLASKGAILVVPSLRMVSIPEINRLYDFNAATLGALAYPDVNIINNKTYKTGPVRFIRHDASHFRSQVEAMKNHFKINAKLSFKAAKLIYPLLDQRLMDERWSYKGQSVSRTEIEHAIFRIRHESHWIQKKGVDYAGSFINYKKSFKLDISVSDNADNPPTTLQAVEWVLDHWEQVWE